jgi:hypothetical protein
LNSKAIFSPNLERHLAYDFITQGYLIKDILDEKPDVIIPKGIISREKNAHLGKTEEEFEQAFLKRFMFVSEEQFRLLSV